MDYLGARAARAAPFVVRGAFTGFVGGLAGCALGALIAALIVGGYYGSRDGRPISGLWFGLLSGVYFAVANMATGAKCGVLVGIIASMVACRRWPAVIASGVAGGALGWFEVVNGAAPVGTEPQPVMIIWIFAGTGAGATAAFTAIRRGPTGSEKGWGKVGGS